MVNAEVDTIRAHTRSVVTGAVSTDHPVLIEAPPNSGKTHAALSLAGSTSTPITYLAGRTDLYDQATTFCENELEKDIETHVIPSPHRHCPTFRGENDGSNSYIRRLYNKGYSARKLHYLPKDEAYTPCMNGSDPCPFIRKRDSIDDDLYDIDLLIGNHQHALNQQYVRDRLVVIDEFNPDPFVDRFPSNDSAADDPGELVSNFITKANNSGAGFPSYVDDVTDIIVNRNDSEFCEPLIWWFRENGITRSDVEDYDFLNVSGYEYNRDHAFAPLLTLSLLCMEKVSPGYELAPPAEGSSRREAWKNAGLDARRRCVRNRNTGAMHLLRSPDLSTAEQVIALDAFPSLELWNAVYAPVRGFDHQQVIDREAAGKFISSAMDVSIKQIGTAERPYSSGGVSDLDEDRFEFVKSVHGEIPLISTKKALQEYYRKGWLERFAKTTDAEGADWQHRDELGQPLMVKNFSSILSSNDFAREDVGVVSGSPHPGNHVIDRWTAFCERSASTTLGDSGRTREEISKEVEAHFRSHRVLQAILRFGRDRSVWEGGGTTVYVNTTVVPDWIEIDEQMELANSPKREAVIEGILRAKRRDRSELLSQQSASTLAEHLRERTGESFDTEYVKTTLEELCDQGLAEVRRNAGRGGADLYEWTGEDYLVESGGSRTFVCAGSRLYKAVLE